jgi:hypothetical protein
MRHIFILLALIATQLLGAQNISREFGDISHAEMDLTQYDKDTDAGAVILFDLGESRFIDDNKDYNLRFIRTKRIKIFDNSALDHAEISIPFYVDGFERTETVKQIHAYTYNKVDGRILRTALNESDIYEEKINEWWRRKKFVFPNVQEGSVLEVRYVVESPFLFNLTDWTYQDEIPTIYSQYKVRFIPFYEYTFFLQGATSFDMHTTRVSDKKRTWGTLTRQMGRTTGRGVEYKERIFTTAMKDVPAFKDESFITSINDYIIKLDFQLSKITYPDGRSEEIINSWPELSKTLLNHFNFGKYIKRSKRFAKKALRKSIELEGQTDLQKIETLIKYVKQNYTWNGNNSKYAAKTAKKFISQKTGNSAEINLFLLALLDAADIEAYPIILSTRKNGKINDKYPFAKYFNNVIVLAGSKQLILADATNVFLPFHKIPIRCINGKGLMVDKKEPNWVALKDNNSSLKQHQITITPNPETLKAATSISSVYSDYEAGIFKEKHRNDTASIKDSYLSKDVSQINGVRTRNYDKPEQLYHTFIQGEADIEKIGDKIVISPFLSLPMNENKLIQKKRTYPVDLIYAREESFTAKIHIPEGYDIEYLPDNTDISDDLVDILLNYE